MNDTFNIEIKKEVIVIETIFFIIIKIKINFKMSIMYGINDKSIFKCYNLIRIYFKIHKKRERRRNKIKQNNIINNKYFILFKITFLY